MAISVLTADCVPIILYDEINNVIGCIHAGWKGALCGIIENTINEVKQLNMPFGYKANLWKVEEPVPVHKFASPNDEVGANPVEAMGTRENYTDVNFLEFSKKMKAKGATILGGCCETKPSHIKAISNLKN